MSSQVFAGDTSGSITIQAPAVAGTGVLTLPANTTGTLATNGPAFAGYASAAVALVQNVATKIPINVEEFDTNNCFDSTTNYRFTPTVPGYYHFGASIEAVNSAYLRAMIYKNGSLWKYSGDSATTNAPYNQNVTALIYLNGTTDFVEFYVFQGNGTLNTSTSYSVSSTNYFYGFMVRGV
jgi:hypothetical protein